MRMTVLVALCVLFPFVGACDSGGGNDDGEENGEDEEVVEREEYTVEEFVMGVDLSYVNQVQDYGGVYRDSTGEEVGPYAHFAERGANVVRVRLWHDPEWVREEVYEDAEGSLYSGLADVTETIRKAKAQDMAVNLDLHYSDVWADPETQDVPEAWRDIERLAVLKDSVYQYTTQTLQHLNREGLMPEMVQIGNETNCGMMYTDAPSDFPKLNVCDGEHWGNLGEVLNSGIRAVRDVSENSDVDPKVLLHVAQPENVEWWFDNVTSRGEVSNFDVVGFSYYAPWSDVPLDEISDRVSTFTQGYQRGVMILETAYPWTMENADDYDNIFGEDSRVDGYPATPEGQKAYVIDLTQEVIDGQGDGVMYWEPAWIASDMRDLWGQGSAWENNAFFDFQGRELPVFDYLTHPYSF
jgi:arabinogalactan endo-1,4-beta-galactosidase